MCVDRRRRYSDEVRCQAVELIQNGAGRNTLMKWCGFLVVAARNWIRFSPSVGVEALMVDDGYRHSDFETKDHSWRVVSCALVMARYGIRSAYTRSLVSAIQGGRP